mmetsp:Transcript_13112/g.26677  ORF Transcript_13112/g.26677 Transcript_13112/m.26677 type:complete len:1108 (-) Transcript_13112:159-3482(-)
MVEIIPYEEDDDDPSLWVPLAPLYPGSATGENSNNNTVTRAPGRCQGLHQVLSSEIFSGDVYGDDIIDDEGDDEGWEALSSVPLHDQLLASPASEQNLPSLNFWEEQVVSHLTSTTQTTSYNSETISLTGNSDENDEASEGEENVPWRRIDNKDNIISNQSDSIGRNTIHREHVSLSDGSYRLPSDQHRYAIKPRISGKQGNIDQTLNTPSGDPRHGNVKNVKSPNENDENQQTNKNKFHSTNYSSQEILQQRLVYDPLRSLPFAFLRHFYRQFYGTVRAALESYVEENELPNILAPLTLVALLLIFGMMLVINGVVGLVSLALPFVVNSTRIALALVIEGIWNLAKHLAFIVLVISLLLGLVVSRCVRVPRDCNAAKVVGSSATSDSMFSDFFVLHISTILPWFVACTSPSMYEAFVIFASTRVCLSVILSRNSSSVQVDSIGECPSSDNINEGATEFMASRTEDDPLSVYYNEYEPSPIQPVLLTLFVAVIVISSVIITANISDCGDLNGDNCEVGNGASTDAPVRVPFIKSTDADECSLDAALSKKSTSKSGSYYLETRQKLSFHLRQIRRHFYKCHTVSIVTLASISLFLSFLRSLCIEYKLYLRGGGSILSLLTNTIGKLGFSILHLLLGLRIFLFVVDKVVSATTGDKCTDITDQLTSGVHWNVMATAAFKEAVVEVSLNTVWGSTKEDGGFAHGVFSDADDALRFAVLKWLIERWSLSAKPSMESGSLRSDEDYLYNNSTGDVTQASGSEDSFGGRDSFDGLGAKNEDKNYEGEQSKTTSVLPSYESLQNVIASIDADETLIPSIRKCKSIIYSLPPSEHAVQCVVLWKMCPAIFMTLALSIWSIFWFAARCILLCLANCPGLISVKKNDALSDDSNEARFDIGMSGNLVSFAIYLAIVSSILFLEYLQLQHWSCQELISRPLNAERDSNNQDELIQKKHRMMTILLRDGMNDWQSKTNFISSFLLRVWRHLTESISVLESSVPVVRCATVASTSVNLASNAVCLFDFASEIQERGLIGGIGVIIWDSFCYHLSEEIRSRNGGSQKFVRDDDEIKGKYTSATVDAMNSVRKLSRNISSLISSKTNDDSPETEGERIITER